MEARKVSKKKVIEFDLQLNNLQNIRNELKTVSAAASKFSQEFARAGTNTNDINSALKNVEKAISIIQTKVSADGKIQTSDAKELLDVLQQLSASTKTLENQSGITAREFKTQFQQQSQVVEEQKQKVLELAQEYQNLKEQQSKMPSLGKSASRMHGLDDTQKSLLVGMDDQAMHYNFEGRSKTGDFTSTQKEWFASNNFSNEQIVKIQQKILEVERERAVIQQQITQKKEEQDTANRTLLDQEQKLRNIETQKVSFTPDTQLMTDTTGTMSGYINAGVMAAEQTGSQSFDIDIEKIGKQTNALQGLNTVLNKNRIAWRLFNTIVRTAVNTVKDMDKALTGMTAVTGQTREEVYQLTSQLRDLAQATSSTLTEVAELTTEYLRQGRAMEDALVLAEETAKAAQIAEISTSDSLTYMTSAINGFNLAAEDAAQVSDIFANVAAKTATDYEQLAVALSKVSAQANLAGLSIEYTTGLLAKGIETTQEAPESIGTALKTILARMRELTDYNKVLEDGTSINNVEKALSAAGIALRDESGSFRDLETIFNELGPKWDNLNSMQQQAIAQAVAGTR